MSASPPRRGLEAVPDRVPRLPGLAAPPPPSAAGRAGPAGAERPAVPAAPERTLRPREFQLDKEARDYLDATAFAIRLRTDEPFDRSALLRGIVGALRQSPLDVAGRCDSEEAVCAYLLRHLGGEAE